MILHLVLHLQTSCCYNYRQLVNGMHKVRFRATTPTLPVYAQLSIMRRTAVLEALSIKRQITTSPSGCEIFVTITQSDSSDCFECIEVHNSIPVSYSASSQ